MGGVDPRGQGEPLTLVLDASAALPACARSDGFGAFGRQRLVAPPLMWSEARSVLHSAVWRGRLAVERANQVRSRLNSQRIRVENPTELDDAAWKVADELGWAKTYDAEYVALARLLGCRLVTRDLRLRRGADRLGFVIGPTEI